MKLVNAKLVTRNVAALARFYDEILGIPRIGSEDYTELRMKGGSLAISSKRSVDLFGPPNLQPIDR